MMWFEDQLGEMAQTEEPLVGSGYSVTGFLAGHQRASLTTWNRHEEWAAICECGFEARGLLSWQVANQRLIDHWRRVYKDRKP